MGDLRFDENGRPIKSTPLKWYEIILLSIGGIIAGLLIGFLLFKFGAI